MKPHRNSCSNSALCTTMTVSPQATGEGRRFVLARRSRRPGCSEEASECRRCRGPCCSHAEQSLRGRSRRSLPHTCVTAPELKSSVLRCALVPAHYRQQVCDYLRWRQDSRSITKMLLGAKESGLPECCLACCNALVIAAWICHARIRFTRWTKPPIFAFASSNSRSKLPSQVCGRASAMGTASRHVTEAGGAIWAEESREACALSKATVAESWDTHQGIILLRIMNSRAW